MKRARRRSRQPSDKQSSLPKRPALISITDELEAFHQDVGQNALNTQADADDELIAYLERKLAIKGSKEKSDAVLRRVAEEEFGGDAGLVDIIKGVLDEEETPVSEGEDGSAAEETAESSDAASLGESIENSDKESAEASAEEERLTPRAADAPRGKRGPPADLLAESKVAIRRGFNRVGEGNLLVTGGEMVKTIIACKDKLQLSMIDSEEVSAHVSRFVDEVTTACAEEALAFLHIKAALALTAPQAALLCLLSAQVSTQVLLKYLTVVIKEFEDNFSSYCARDTDVMTERGVVDLADKETARQCVHSVALIAYNGFLDMDFLVEFCRHLGTPSSTAIRAVETETRLELLALIFRICAVELKANYAPQFQEIEAITKGLITVCEARRQEEGQERASMHLEWIQHELANVGKHRKAPMYEKFAALRTALRKYRSDGALEILESQRCLAAMLRGDAVAAAAAAADARPVLDRSAATDSKTALSVETEQLRNLAKQNHIRAPLQQDVFIGLAQATTVTEAMTNVLRCVTSARSIEPALAVILHCLLQESAYNPFYAAVTSKLCSMPDESWRKKFLRGIRRGLYLITANEDVFAEQAPGGSSKKEKLKQFVNELKDDLSERDYTQLMSRQIFN